MLFPKFVSAYIIAIIFSIGKIYPTLVIVIDKQAKYLDVVCFSFTLNPYTSLCIVYHPAVFGHALFVQEQPCAFIPYLNPFDFGCGHYYGKLNRKRIQR